MQLSHPIRQREDGGGGAATERRGTLQAGSTQTGTCIVFFPLVGVPKVGGRAALPRRSCICRPLGQGCMPSFALGKLQPWLEVMSELQPVAGVELETWTQFLLGAPWAPRWPLWCPGLGFHTSREGVTPESPSAPLFTPFCCFQPGYFLIWSTERIPVLLAAVVSEIIAMIREGLQTLPTLSCSFGGTWGLPKYSLCVFLLKPSQAPTRLESQEQQEGGSGDSSLCSHQPKEGVYAQKD